jgi:steroid 5-alpha reductase family enzyme
VERQLQPKTGNKRRIAEVRRRAEKDTVVFFLFSAFLSYSALLRLLISFSTQQTQFQPGTTAQLYPCESVVIRG